MDSPSEISIPPDTHAEASPQSSSRKRYRKLFFRLWLVLAAGFVLYLYLCYRASGFDSAVLRSDARVFVTHGDDVITFAPAHDAKRASLIFIPGAMVETTAYAPLARAVAEHGYTVILLKLPLRMASTESQQQAVASRITAIIASGNSSMRWVVSGHSAGGVVACRVARDHHDLLAGLVLIGTSHPRDFDLSGLTIDVTKVSATNDGLASPVQVQANAAKLPIRTRWVTIDGGNHSQFGYYGFQLGDHRATISRSAQQAATTEAILDTLGRASAADGR